MNGAHQQAPKAVGQICTSKELDGLAVFLGAFPEMNLPEISRELSLLVAATRYVFVGRDDFAPRLQAHRACAVEHGSGCLALLATHLLVEANAQKLGLHLLELFRLLWRRDGTQEPSGGIER